MDFFEAQARARKRTGRLTLLFILAVVSTVIAGYFAAILVLGQIGPRAEDVQSAYWGYQRTGLWTGSLSTTRWWDPRIFMAVSLGTLAVVGLASLYKWHQFNAGGSAVAESVGGRRVDPGNASLAERRLINVVEEMAIASGTPVPGIFVLPDEAGINAFAAGLTASDAVIAVTRGTLEKLTRDELQGVVAHEFSHILNGDMRLNLRITSIIFGILVLGIIGRAILWSMRGMRGSRGKGSGGIMAAVAFAGLALLVIGYVGYFFGRLIQAAVSRQREFLADASAVQFTRQPAGIAGALKKIGGYALGSSLQSQHSTAIGHFFFAQGFRSGLTGLWSTHPPLAERIRAIDPGFDGRMFEPPETVDVARESFVAAGLVGATARRSPAAPPLPAVDLKAFDLRTATLSAVSLVGTLTPEQIANARLLLDSTPARLRAAARTATRAGVLLYGLLLDPRPVHRARQRALVASRAGGEALTQLDELEADLLQLRPEHKLPLLQLALPALRTLSPGALDTFLGVLDELVHSDSQVSVFEFTLQKLIIHTLELGRAPGTPGTQIHSFAALAEEISVVLSALARAAVSDPCFAGSAFSQGVAHLRMIEGKLHFLDEARCDFAALDRALDQLAVASPAIRQRLVEAASHVVGADGRVLVTEFELLRAIAAALDCPMPPLASAG